jgi:hypothetical protein
MKWKMRSREERVKRSREEMVMRSDCMDPETLQFHL